MSSATLSPSPPTDDWREFRVITGCWDEAKTLAVDLADWETFRSSGVSEDGDVLSGRAERRWIAKPIIMQEIIAIASVSTVPTVLQNMGLPNKIFVLGETLGSTGGANLTEGDRFCTVAAAAKRLVRPEPMGWRER